MKTPFSEQLSAILVPPTIEMNLPYLIPVSGHGLGQLITCPFQTPPLHTDNWLVLEDTAFGFNYIFLRTLYGVRSHAIHTYVGNPNKNELCKEKKYLVGFFVSSEVTGSRWDDIIWDLSTGQKYNFEIYLFPHTLILQSGSLRESLLNLSENQIIDSIKWKYPIRSFILFFQV